MDWTNGLWTFNGESKKRTGHPAPFPMELPRRCIKLFSFVGDTVLDPFMGSGTTLVAALETGRLGIGIELERRYCALARARLKRQEEASCPSASSSRAAHSTSSTTKSAAASRSRIRTSPKS
jgi:DNA modification methylase